MIRVLWVLETYSYSQTLNKAQSCAALAVDWFYIAAPQEYFSLLVDRFW